VNETENVEKDENRNKRCPEYWKHCCFDQSYCYSFDYFHIPCYCIPHMLPARSLLFLPFVVVYDTYYCVLCNYFPVDSTVAVLGYSGFVYDAVGYSFGFDRLIAWTFDETIY